MKVIAIPCSFDNYSYLLICEQSRQAAIVDPTEAYPLMVALEKNEVVLKTIFCTHHHHDHIGGIEDLQAETSGFNIVCYQGDKNRIPIADTYVDHDDRIQIGEQLGRVLHTPGHTSGSICYYFNEHLFVGDTLFGGGCGRLFEGTPEQMHTSLSNQIAVLPDETKVYFGHEYTRTNLEFALTVDPDNIDVQHRLSGLKGETNVSTPSTIALEKRTNPFLRADADDIRNTLQTKYGVLVNTTLDVFTTLRQMRNSFS